MNKYPENEKLDEIANVHSTLMQFTEFLEENHYEIKNFDTGVYVTKSFRFSVSIYECRYKED